METLTSTSLDLISKEMKAGDEGIYTGIDEADHSLPASSWLQIVTKEQRHEGYGVHP